MAILNHSTEPLAELAIITNRDYALAAFIMGALLQAEVVQIDEYSSDAQSDIHVGIRIIAACLKCKDSPDDTHKLPFQW